jgi:hypothetical protein
LPEQRELEEENDIKQALHQLQSKRKERSRMFEEDLKAIDQEDKDNIIIMREEDKQEGSP